MTPEKMTIFKLPHLLGMLLLIMTVTACDSAGPSGRPVFDAPSDLPEDDSEDEVDAPRAWHEGIYGYYRWENPDWLNDHWYVGSAPYPGSYSRCWFLSSVEIAVIPTRGVRVTHGLTSRVFEGACWGVPSPQVMIITETAETFEYYVTKPVDAMPEWVLEVAPDDATFQFSSSTQLIYSKGGWVIRLTK